MSEGRETQRSGARPGTGAGLSRGPGRLLLVVYVVFAISAGARSAFQIATQFSVAPEAFLLSALAAAVYVVAAVALAREARAVALVAVWVELVGVLGVGTLSLLRPQDFPEPTVWSDFGVGYGFVPVVLPVLGLLWLRHVSGGGRDSDA